MLTTKKENYKWRETGLVRGERPTFSKLQKQRRDCVPPARFLKVQFAF